MKNSNFYDDGFFYEADEFVDDYQQPHDEGEYLPQQIGCFEIFVSVTIVSIILVLVFSSINLSGSENQELAINSGRSDQQEGKQIASLFTPEVQYWSQSIIQWSQETGIDSNLIATVMQIESCGDPFAKSNAGAQGLFQVMPYHFETGEDPFHPATNAFRGLDYLGRALSARNGSIPLGFAGYNGGITGAKRPESQWADETKRYVYWGSGIFEDAAKGKQTSDRLNEWLESGGTSLCNQAADRLGINQ